MSDGVGGFDLAPALEVAAREDEGQVVHIHDQLGEPLYYENGSGKKPVTITVVGTYSKRYRASLDQQQGKQFKRRRFDPEDARKDTLEILSRCVLAWEGVYNQGQPLEFNRKNVLDVLAVPFVREQVEVAMGDHAGFFKTSSPG